MKTLAAYAIAAFLAFASELEPKPETTRTVWAYPCYANRCFCFYDAPSPSNEFTPVVVQVDSCKCRTRIELKDEYRFPVVGEVIRINKWQGGSWCGKIIEIQY